jgi:hypothetical protein
MVAEFAQVWDDAACACCSNGDRSATARARRVLPRGDFCCSACDRAIYQALVTQ